MTLYSLGIQKIVKKMVTYKKRTQDKNLALFLTTALGAKSVTLLLSDKCDKSFKFILAI